MDAEAPTAIVLIHGLWMTPRSWENWAARYEERGHRVTGPAWPGLEAEVEELRRDPTRLTQLSVTMVVDHYDRIIGGLDSPPIVIAAFGDDHVIPAKASRHNAEKYRKSSAVTEFKEFPGRPHLPGAPGWEEIADYSLDWALRNARRS